LFEWCHERQKKLDLGLFCVDCEAQKVQRRWTGAGQKQQR